jgi:hypothetical protein
MCVKRHDIALHNHLQYYVLQLSSAGATLSEAQVETCARQLEQLTFVNFVHARPANWGAGAKPGFNVGPGSADQLTARLSDMVFLADMPPPADWYPPQDEGSLLPPLVCSANPNMGRTIVKSTYE